MTSSPIVHSFADRLGRLRLLRFAALLLCLVLPLSLTAQTTSHWLTGYYAVYDQNGTMSTAQLDYTKLTHVIYWPIIPNTGTPGTLDTTAFVSSSTFASGATDIVKRAHAAGIKALIGIGGDEYTPVGDQGKGATAGFQISTTSTYQATFISNIIALMQQYGFDGVDINWEAIQTSDNSDFTTFITNLRSQLNSVSTSLVLTMAPETQMNGGRPDLLSQVYQYLNQINIQTYQMSGPYCGWETWYNSPLNGGNFVLESNEALPTITNSVAAYTSKGIPISKLAMGIQFDSEVWKGGAGTSTGGVTQPHQTWTNDASNCGSNPYAPTTSDLTYRDTLANLTTAAGYTSTFDSTADQVWLSYDPSGNGTTNEANDTWVSLDNPTSIAKKGVDLSAGTGQGGTLGGAFLFELSDDFLSSAAAGQQHPLLTASAAMQMLLPGLATGFSATPSATSASLSWTAAPFATNYKIYYSTSSGSLGTLSSTVTGTTATVSGLNSSTLYYFTVVPSDFFGSSSGTQTSATTTGGTAATATLSPTSFTFQNRAVGTTSSAAAFTLSNSGGSTLTGIAVSLAGANPSDFSDSTTCGTTLAAGSSCSISVFFKPTAAGNRQTTLMVANSVATATAAISGMATAGPGTATLSPSSFTFQSRAVGTTSAAATFTLTNSGSSAVTGVSVSLTGTNPGDFSESNTCGSTLAANSSCNISVYFKPTAAGTRQTTLSVANSVATATAAISGTATAGAAAIALSPTSFTFQGRAVGTTSAAASFTLSNSGGTAATGVAVSLTGTNPGDFSESTNCGSTLAANSSCAISVYFKPTAAGTRQTTLSVASSTATVTAAISGTATAGPATATLAPTSFTFNNRTVGTMSSAAFFTLTNSGSTAVTGVSVSLAGANPGDFSDTTTCGATLAANSSCSISVFFKPTAVGSRQTTLTVANSVATATAAVSGTGTAAATLSPTTYSFPSTPVGSTSASQSFTFTNSSGSTLTGVAASLTGANPSEFTESTTCGTTLAAGSSCTVTVAFAPVSAATYNATLSVASNVPTVTAALSGTGTSAAPNRVVWVPDFYSGVLNVRVGNSNTAISVSLPSCNPNAVAVNSAYAFVICTANGGNPDKILVYNAPSIRSAPAGSLSINPLQTYLGGASGSGLDFSGLIGAAFDPSGNLWVTSNNNNLVLSILASTLGTANPAFTQQLNDSPSAPAGITFASDGSAWLTGEVNGAGIALNFTPDQFAGGGQIPRYCLLAADEGAGSSCQLINGIFESPEGIAIVNGDIWVANNGVGGTTPGRQIVDLKIVNGAISVNATFGDPNNPSASPFVCPGGLFSTPVHLWLNDESYGESSSNLHCGGNGDVAGATGGVFSFTPAQLSAQTTTISSVLAYSNITGRPGFGGIFVENDQ